jgi:hypothetical protein
MEAKIKTKDGKIVFGGERVSFYELAKQEICIERGLSAQTLHSRFKNGSSTFKDLFREKNSDNLWEGVPDKIRKACESGSNKHLLEVK